MSVVITAAASGMARSEVMAEGCEFLDAVGVAADVACDPDELLEDAASTPAGLAGTEHGEDELVGVDILPTDWLRRWYPTRRQIEQSAD